MKYLITTAITALTLAGFASAAQAEDIAELYPQSISALDNITAELPAKAKIAVARLDGGRMIATPYGELEDWMFLDRRTDANIVQLGASNYLKYTPELPMGAQPSSNKIDEVRLAAANEGLDYVLIYGVGPDATWASFGGTALVETGLTVKPDCAAWDEARAKALLVNSRNGDVLGAVIANNIDFNIGELADQVEGMITELSTPIKMAAISENPTEDI